LVVDSRSDDVYGVKLSLALQELFPAMHNMASVSLRCDLSIRPTSVITQ
jgi:hypothetical protein